MKKLSDQSYLALVMISFIVLNMLNRIIVTSQTFNPGVNLFKNTLFTTFNAFMGDLGFLLVCLTLCLLIIKKKRSLVIALTGITIGLSSMIFGLKVYAFYYSTAFSFFNARTFSNSAPVLGRQLTLHLWKNLIVRGQIIAIIPAIIFIYFMIHAIRKKRFTEAKYFEKDKQSYLRLSKVFVIGALMFSFSQIAYFASIKNTYYEHNRMALKGVQTMGVYNYYIYDLISFSTRGPRVELKDDQLKDEILRYIQSKKTPCPKNYMDNPACAFFPATGIFEDKNLVVIQLESFQSFVLGLEVEDEFGDLHEVTPFFNQLLNTNNALYFNNFYANAGVGRTSDGEFATLTGLNPTGSIVTYYEYIHEYYETLPKLFTERGYETYAITGSTYNFYRRDEVYPMLGFNPLNIHNQETLEELGYYNPETDTVNGWVDDDIIFNFVTDLLKKDEKSFIFTMTTVLHTPYASVEGITGINPWAQTITGDLGNYLDYVIRTDQMFEDFYLGLRDQGLLEDTVIMLYGDHTSGLSMSDFSFFNPELDILDYQKYSHNLPFIVLAEGQDLSDFRSNRHLVRGQVDIKRTVSNLFRLNEKVHFGVDMLSPIRTWTYNPLSMDLFTDDFHLIVPSERSDDPLMDSEEMQRWIQQFFDQKHINDAVLKYCESIKCNFK